MPIIYLVCGAGGRLPWTGKVLKEMGYDKVVNIGGFGDWERQAARPKPD